MMIIQDLCLYYRVIRSDAHKRKEAGTSGGVPVFLLQNLSMSGNRHIGKMRLRKICFAVWTAHKGS